MIKKLLIDLYNAPNALTLPHWAQWNITSIANIEALPETDEGALGLAGNLCIDADEDDNITDEWYKTYVAPIQNYLDEYYKPDAQQQLNDRLK